MGMGRVFGITFEETRAYREIKEEGRLEGKLEVRGAFTRSLILRQLNRKVGELPQVVSDRLEGLSLEQLENLGEALLDFTSLTDLEVWLNALAD